MSAVAEHIRGSNPCTATIFRLFALVPRPESPPCLPFRTKPR